MKIEIVEKLVANLHEQKEYVVHIRNLKQALNQRLVLKTVNELVKSNQEAWLQVYIDMNKELKNAKK